MSYDSVPGPGDPSVPGPAGPSAFPGSVGAPYGAPGGQPYGGPGGPGYGPGFPGGQPPKKGKSGLIAGLSIAGVVVVALVVLAGVLVFGGDDIDDLPAPKTLGRDPVPAEKRITAKPAHCGISKATVKALTPGRKAPTTGEECNWSGFSGGDLRELDVDYHGTARGYEKTSWVASAIENFEQSTSSTTYVSKSEFTPIAGLGDDAAYTAGSRNGTGVEAKVVFRVADVVTTVTYNDVEATEAATEKYRRGAFRAAAEVAKGLGAAANPAVAKPGRTAPVTVPSDVCELVPRDLMETLSGDSGPHPYKYDNDAIINKELIPSASSSGCRTSSHDSENRNRFLEAHVTGPTSPGADAVVKRQYLAAYYEARAERPATGGDGRYFQALSGLGDQAFVSYVDGKRRQSVYGTNTAVVVIRSRTALITVEFGGDLGESGLTQQQTINGAYAVAQKVAVGVK